MKPRIGITTALEEGQQRLHRAYVQAVEQAGGLPLIVPMLDQASGLQAFAQLLDGLVIVGGPAVEDGLVGTLPDDIDGTDPVRVRSDKEILAAFLAMRKPMLGICYGMQLLNALGGGGLYADVQAQVEGTAAHSTKRGGGTHTIHLVPGTHLRSILGRDVLEVNTRHIQALASVGTAYRVSAVAPDGVIEAIENEDGTVLGVQFHPERMGVAMQPLFRHLVAQAVAVAP